VTSITTPLPGLAGDQPLVLAPLEDITDGPFRRLARRFGADLVYTEFVSAEAIVHGAAKAERKLLFAQAERPIAIQIVGSRVAALVEAARAAAAAAPDLIDLNFGCPARKVAGKGAGAGLLRTPDLLEEMTREVVRATACPVTAKVRLGWDSDSINVLDIARRIERAGARAIAIHARTRSQGFSGRADWSWIARVKQAVTIPVIGNGDVASPEDAARMFADTGCDAVMIGRAAMGNPWIFRATRAYLRTGERVPPPGAPERMAVLLDHLRDAAQAKGEQRAVIEMRKHYRGYLRGLPGAARLRAAMMTPVSCAGVAALLMDYLTTEASPDADPPDLV
jgi:tRNA-dihydrouridine synthase B